MAGAPRSALRPLERRGGRHGGGADGGRHSAIHRAGARHRPAVLADENERRTAQGILDYWSTELLSQRGAIAEDFLPALLAPFDSARSTAAAGAPAPPAKLPVEEDARELIRFVATARLWRDSGRLPGYLLNDEASIAQAARFKHLDRDLFELVAESEIALNKKRWTQRFAKVVGILALVIIGMLGFTVFREAQLREADRRAAEEKELKVKAEQSAAASIASVERIVRVLSRQTDNRTITITAAAELFKGAESILTAQDEQQLPEVSEAHARLLVQFSDVYLNAGDSRSARASAEHAEQLAGQLVKRDPGNESWQRLLYQSAFQIGDIAASDDPKRTREKYDLALGIAQTLASNSPGSVDRQKDVTFMMNKEGDLDRMAGAWGSALSWYRKSLEIGKGLTADEPQQNRAARKIVGDAWARIAGLSAAQGHYDDALAQYQDALSIRKALAAEVPKDEDYQGNLAATYHFIGGVYKDDYDATHNGGLLDKAEQQYNEALAIRQARANKEPGNASRQDSLQQENLAIADVLFRKQDVAGAIAKYQTALAIREALVIKDPNNASWKANLANTHDGLAKALVQEGQFDAALNEYQAALDVRIDLAAQFPDDRGRQVRLATAYEHKGDGLTARGKALNGPSDLREAIAAYQGALAIIDAIMRNAQGDKAPGDALAPTRERLRKKIEGLTRDAQ